MRGIIENMERYLDRNEKEAQGYLDTLKAELNKDEPNYMWALRRTNHVVHAAVQLHHYKIIRGQIEAFKEAVAGISDDEGYTERVTNMLGGNLTPQALVDYLVTVYTKKCLQVARDGGHMMSPEQLTAERDVTAQIVEDAQFYWG